MKDFKIKERKAMNKMIDPKFLNHEMYSIYSAVLRVVGPEKQKKIVNLSGKLMFSELEDELNLSKISDPVDLVKTLIKYLEDVGYFSKGEVEQKSDNELLVHMHGATYHDAVVKLKNEGTFPPHCCTTLIFAGLKKLFNINVELSHLDLGSKKPPYHTVEKWKFLK